MSAAGLALGTVQWGLNYGIANSTGRPTAESVRDLLVLARAAGVRFLDTARAYGDSERVIGETTAGDGFWSIVTKLAPDAVTPEQAAASLDASRQALRRKTLDAVLLHRWITKSAVWDVLRRERDGGRIERLGASATDPDEAWEMLADPDVGVIQVATSLFDQRLRRAGYFERAAGAGKAVFVRSVFLQGAAHLPPDRLPPHLDGLAETAISARTWAADRGQGVAVPFLAFAATLPGVWVLLGCESVGQLTANLRDWDVAKQLGGEVGSLAASIPDLPADVLNPVRWPKL